MLRYYSFILFLCVSIAFASSKRHPRKFVNKLKESLRAKRYVGGPHGQQTHYSQQGFAKSYGPRSLNNQGFPAQHYPTNFQQGLATSQQFGGGHGQPTQHQPFNSQPQQQQQYRFSFPGSIIQQYPMTIAQGNTVRECYDVKNRGKDYIGHVNKTASGSACQPWASNKPHRHHLHGLNSHGNYCRNPMIVIPAQCQTSSGCIQDKPWCYTTRKPDPTERRVKRWELCDVPKCPWLV